MQIFIRINIRILHVVTSADLHMRIIPQASVKPDTVSLKRDTP